MPKNKKSGKGRRKSDGKYWVGFDLGGTKMMALVFDDAFNQVARKRKRSKARDGQAAGMERMIGTIQEALDEAGIGPGDLGGIGVGCPGPLNLVDGIVLEMPNLRWKNMKVREALENVFHCPVVVANDVDGGVYGEYRFGAARNGRCVLGVFPGTGIGGGAVYEGRIVHGRTGSCMEIGHIPVVPDGPRCGCGRRGCLEAVAGRLAISAQAAMAVYRGEAPHLQKIAGTDIINIRSAALAAAVRNGDAAIEHIIRDAARHIGRAMAGAVDLLNPDTILLGGGLVEEMPDIFVEEIKASANAQCMLTFADTFEVVVAELGDDATATGVGAWAQKIL